jgi:hypothetical protein
MSITTFFIVVKKKQPRSHLTDKWLKTSTTKLGGRVAQW